MVDSKNIRGAIEQLPEQLREGGRIGVAAGERLSMPAAVVLAGMGGSAVGGELMRGLIAGSCPVPVTRVRGFGVPTFVGPGTLVVCTSYSGDTAETLACARQAHDRGASVLAVGAGGRLGELAREGGAPFAQVPSGLFRAQRWDICSAPPPRPWRLPGWRPKVCHSKPPTGPSRPITMRRRSWGARWRARFR